MPRKPNPENAIYSQIRPLMNEARESVGIPKNGYRIREDDKTHRLAYAVKINGTPAPFDKSLQPGKKYYFDDPWDAIWRAIGSSGPATLDVAIWTTSPSKNGGDPNEKYKIVGSVKVPTAKELFPERVNKDGVLVD